ncbi:hypothetical protein AB0K80_09370 [Streptomyces sp. NPDC052682]|uniref:hypothetical protein n=1 Tax=Streptomyces sp. NPDC052682 TaxID=3154954 RepID=UPI0034219EE0
MAGSQGSWTSGGLTARELLRPKHAARAVFHPAWIPDSLDPEIEYLKKARLIAGAVAAVGVYTFLEGGFALTEVLANVLTASAVLLFITPLTLGVMLAVWRRGGTVRALKAPLFNSLKLLLLFVGSIAVAVLLLQNASAFGLAVVPLGIAGLWMAVFVVRGAVHISGNFFGTAAVHRCLPPLLATVTSWLMALSDLFTGDLHGLGLAMGVVFILGAPVTVTGIAVLETRRLRTRYGIRLSAHPASLPRVPGPPPPFPPMPPTPPAGPPYVPPQGSPYGTRGTPPPGNPYGNPYRPGSGSR